MKISTFAAPALLCAALAACSDSATSLVCPSRSGPSLVVYVLDAESGESVSRQASGSWAGGGMRDSLHHWPTGTGDTVLAAFGPPGTYEVRVSRPGHAEWVRTGVEVGEGQCGPARTEFTATLSVVEVVTESE